MKRNPALATLDRVVGTWTVTGSHPYLPGRTLHGRVTFEPVEDGAFIRMHSKMDDPEIPEGVAIFGTDDADNTGTMLYFDARGVARKYSVAFDADSFSWSRNAAIRPALPRRYREECTLDGRRGRNEERRTRVGAGPSAFLCSRRGVSGPARQS